MNIVWTSAAAADLRSIYDHITDDNPPAADARLARIVALATRQLGGFPLSGRTGRVRGTREIVVPSTNTWLPTV